MGQKFQCSECEYQATRKSSLVRHQKSVHMGQKFQCPECEYQATQKSSLHILAKNFNVQTVIISQLGNVPLLNIINLYIWA